MSLEIAPVADAGPLPACTPFLMPFHISYNGSAPVSRYLRCRPAPPSLAALSSSTATLVASSSILNETTSGLTSSGTSVGTLAHDSNPGSSTVVDQTDNTTSTRAVVDPDMVTDSETQPALSTLPLSTSTPGSRKRLISAFRGRQIYGQAVDIPSGYGGLVLRASSYSQGRKEEVASKPKSKTRLTSHFFRKRAKADKLEEEHNDDHCPDPDADSLPTTRKLVPFSTFTSFTLWTPDRPLDEGRDEYIRALVEWTHLAEEIHSYDDRE